LFLNDGLEVETLTPYGYIYEERAHSTPAALTVDTTLSTHVSNDPFLMDSDGVTDFNFNIINISVRAVKTASTNNRETVILTGKVTH
jgi:hypothetical protein